MLIFPGVDEQFDVEKLSTLSQDHGDVSHRRPIAVFSARFLLIHAWCEMPAVSWTPHLAGHGTEHLVIWGRKQGPTYPDVFVFWRTSLAIDFRLTSSATTVHLQNYSEITQWRHPQDARHLVRPPRRRPGFLTSLPGGGEQRTANRRRSKTGTAFHDDFGLGS